MSSNPSLATGDWDDVSFLANPHRHIFHFHVRISIEHNDREIEFIQAKRFMERLYGNETLQIDCKSCEMLAEDLYKQLNIKWPDREMIIKVFEDDENGAVLEFKKE